MPIFVGGARRVINPEIGDDICGQLHRRFCEYIHDDLEANLLYLRSGQERAPGGAEVILASLDLAGIWVDDDLPSIRAALSAATGVPERSVILTSTHTHEGPDTGGFIAPESGKNGAYIARLRDALVAAAQEAVSGAQPARVGWGRGRAHVGFNRRLCWADGTHSMYGDASRPDFTGLEGPDDPSHSVLWAVDESGRPLAVMHGNCSHATCMENASFASAASAATACTRRRRARPSSLTISCGPWAGRRSSRPSRLTPRTASCSRPSTARSVSSRSPAARCLSRGNACRCRIRRRRWRGRFRCWWTWTTRSTPTC
jgi:hypothetical protein